MTYDMARIPPQDLSLSRHIDPCQNAEALQSDGPTARNPYTFFIPSVYPFHY